MAAVVFIENIAPRHYLVTLHAPAIAAQAAAGQFVHVLTREESNRDPLLRRAFSIMAVEGEQIEVLFRVEGKGTLWLSKVIPGEVIDVLGPLGRPFDLTPLHEKSRRAVLVGGGVGVPPMVYLAKTLISQGIETLAIIGARSKAEVLCEDRFASLGVECAVTTEDGSYGTQGRVTGSLEEALQASAEAVVYSCGPWPMLRAVAAVAAPYNVPCQVSLEENMPCGIGVCNGCVVAMNNTASDFDRYRRICIEGPAVWATEIDWGHN